MLAHYGRKNMKEKVGFEHPAERARHCLMCRHWEGGSLKTCALVQGRIEAGDWCRLFARKGAQRVRPAGGSGGSAHPRVA